LFVQGRSGEAKCVYLFRHSVRAIPISSAVMTRVPSVEGHDISAFALRT
jgi:hypothetical protein